MKLYINGEIVGRQAEKCTPEDVCPQDIIEQLKSLKEGEDIELCINSLGGDVFAGLQICSVLKEASSSGHKTTASITSIAASIASVIACSCQKLNIYEGCYMMVHLPWTCVQGNAIDLAKEISTLEQCKNSMLKIYKTKFDLPDEEIVKMLEAETWIDSDNCYDYKLDCTVVSNDIQIKIAASLKKHNFKNLPKGLAMEEEKKELEEENKENIEQAIEQIEKPEEVKEEEKTEEKKAEEPTVEELQEKIKELEEKLREYEEAEEPEEPEEEKMVTEDECNKRVAGMQSKMQAQINDFTKQLKVRDEELVAVKAEATSLKAELENSKKELSDMTSAFEEKNNALAQLNAGVNSPSETTDWRNLKGKEFFDYLKKNNIH